MATAVASLLAISLAAFGGLSLMIPIENDEISEDGMTESERLQAREVARAHGLVWAPGTPVTLQKSPTEQRDFWPSVTWSAYGRRVWTHNGNRMGGYNNFSDPFRLLPADGNQTDVGMIPYDKALGPQAKDAISERIAYVLNEDLESKTPLSTVYRASQPQVPPPCTLYLTGRQTMRR